MGQLIPDTFVFLTLLSVIHKVEQAFKVYASNTSAVTYCFNAPPTASTLCRRGLHTQAPLEFSLDDVKSSHLTATVTNAYREHV